MNDVELRERLDHFRMLKPNWDSYGADPIKEDFIVDAKQWLTEFPDFFTFVAPCGDGTVQLEHYRYDLGKRHGPFLEFGPQEEAGVYWLLAGDDSGPIRNYVIEEESLTREEARTKILSFKAAYP